MNHKKIICYVFFYVFAGILLCLNSSYAENSYSGVIYSTDADKPDTQSQIIDLQNKTINFQEDKNELKLQKIKSDDMKIETAETSIKPETLENPADIKSNSEYQIKDTIEKTKPAVEFNPEPKKKSKLFWYILGGIAAIALLAA
ncbi:MAG TPA: hypothetical protein PKY81_10005 [bacterium]|nr:hypothetical protein [bacterium]HPN31280.1 hypothetical protein [bacterium]